MILSLYFLFKSAFSSRPFNNFNYISVKINCDTVCVLSTNEVISSLYTFIMILFVCAFMPMRRLHYCCLLDIIDTFLIFRFSSVTYLLKNLNTKNKTIKNNLPKWKKNQKEKKKKLLQAGFAWGHLSLSFFFSPSQPTLHGQTKASRSQANLPNNVATCAGGGAGGLSSSTAHPSSGPTHSSGQSGAVAQPGSMQMNGAAMASTPMPRSQYVRKDN